MNLIDYLKDINKSGCIQLPNGRDKTIKLFFTNCIKNTLPKKEILCQWDSLLNTYVNEPKAIYFIRRHHTDSNNNWNNIRRGFYTKYNNDFCYVFCDNYLAHYFYIMAINQYVPDYKDFYDVMTTRQFPYGFRNTKEEIPYQAFKIGKSVNINNNGWKLAHIFSVNDNYNFDYEEDSKILFPLGIQDEWKIYNGSNYPYRKIDNDIDSIDKSKMKAHFLRLVHPINYFLVPQRKNETDVVSNNNIGEYKELLQYMYLYMQEKYKNIFETYQKNILLDNSYNTIRSSNLGDIEIGIEYGLQIKTTSSVVMANANQVYNEGDIIRAYLKDGLSFRKIESIIMCINSKNRGGGWVTKTILNNLGIENKHKGILKNKTVSAEILTATGKYKQTLVKYKNIL
ncbi:hypothetical protein [Treponema primitia]|uniref:hypothetical protein n=1 Tax=Treponema primitia TaxID=88058 RepID=UPI0002E36CA6|nr:hypothetical protein [Treponema primitia]